MCLPRGGMRGGCAFRWLCRLDKVLGVKASFNNNEVLFYGYFL